MLKFFPILLLLCSTIYGQVDDYLKIRWIEVDDRNLRELSGDCDSCFFNVVFRLIQKENRILFFESDDILDQAVIGYPILKMSEKRWNFAVETKIPLQNVENLDLVTSCGGGMQCYVYAKDSNFYFNPFLIQGFRMREEFVYDSISKSEKWKLKGISPYSTYFSTNEQPFWIDFQRLKLAVQDIGKYQWYEILENREYSGVQFMQMSCEQYDRGNFWR